MAMNFGSDSTQGSIMVDLDSQSQSAVVLKDSSSNEIVSFTPRKEIYKCGGFRTVGSKGRNLHDSFG